MKNSSKKTLITNNMFELINDESSLFIEGGIIIQPSNSQEQKQYENFWQKATYMLDDLI